MQGVWQTLRWILAAGLLVVGAGVVLVSNTTDHLHACSEVTSVAGLPQPLTGQGEQATLRLPVKACNPVPPWTVVPIAGLALLLLLPDYAEVGFGSVSLKRQVQQISQQVDSFGQKIEDIRSSIESAVGIHKDIERGEVRKGAIRNVELRLETVQELLLSTLLANPQRHAESLYETGKQWGQSWSKDFAKIENGLDVSGPGKIQKVLEEWSYYDGTAGMGRIRFTYGADGLPAEAEVVNGFLSIERDTVDLRTLIAGYIAGSLDGLLEAGGVLFDATLRAKKVGSDVYALTVRHIPDPPKPDQVTPG